MGTAERAPTRGGGASSNGALNSDYMLETIVCDLHLSSLHIATLAMLAAAYLRDEPDWTLRPWRNILIDDGAIMQLALKCFADVKLGDEFASRISRLYAGLSAAKAATEPLARIAKRYSSEDRARLAEAAARWKRLRAQSIDVLRDLGPVIAGRLNERFAKDGATLIAFLTEAAGGATSRVSSKGEIRLPQLLQRRRGARAPVGGSCRLIVADRTVEARLVDVSREGIGLVCRHATSVGQALAIEFDDGRRLKATVARRTGDRIGLKLAAPLSGLDPLFRQAQAA